MTLGAALAVVLVGVLIAAFFNSTIGVVGLILALVSGGRTATL